MYRKDFAFRYSPQMLPRKGDIVKYRRKGGGLGGSGEEKKEKKVTTHKALPTKNSKKPHLNQLKLRGCTT